LSLGVFCALWSPFQSDDVELRQTMPLTLDRKGSSVYTSSMSNTLAFVLGAIASPLIIGSIVSIVDWLRTCNQCGRQKHL
jgi:hypothetical protein